MTHPCAPLSCRPPADLHTRNGNQYRRPPIRLVARRIIYTHRPHAMRALRPSSRVRASINHSARVFGKRASRSKAEIPHRACSRRCPAIYSPQPLCRSPALPTRRSHSSVPRPGSRECVPRPWERCSAHKKNAAQPSPRTQCRTSSVGCYNTPEKPFLEHR